MADATTTSSAPSLDSYWTEKNVTGDFDNIDEIIEFAQHRWPQLADAREPHLITRDAIMWAFRRAAQSTVEEYGPPTETQKLECHCPHTRTRACKILDEELGSIQGTWLIAKANMFRPMELRELTVNAIDEASVEAPQCSEELDTMSQDHCCSDEESAEPTREAQDETLAGLFRDRRQGAQRRADINSRRPEPGEPKSVEMIRRQARLLSPNSLHYSYDHARDFRRMLLNGRITTEEFADQARASTGSSTDFFTSATDLADDTTNYTAADVPNSIERTQVGPSAFQGSTAIQRYKAQRQMRQMNEKYSLKKRSGESLGYPDTLNWSKLASTNFLSGTKRLGRLYGRRLSRVPRGDCGSGRG